MRNGCVFCDYEGPSEITLENPSVFSIEPLNPVTPGHRLFIPYTHVDILQTTWNHPVVAQVFAAAAYYVHSSQLEANIISSAGEAATQTVFHLHVHVVPRKPDDGLKLPWSKTGWRELFR